MSFFDWLFGRSKKERQVVDPDSLRTMPTEVKPAPIIVRPPIESISTDLDPMIPSLPKKVTSTVDSLGRLRPPATDDGFPDPFPPGFDPYTTDNNTSKED